MTIYKVKDRGGLKSKLFYVSNTIKGVDGVIKYIEVTPFSNKKSDKVKIFSNWATVYKNGVPIDEIKNIATNSNSELINIIEDRI